MAKVRIVSVTDKNNELWEKGKVVAHRRGISMSALVMQSLEKELNRWNTPSAYLMNEDDSPNS